MIVFDELLDTKGDYRAYGQGRLAGGLQRSSRARDRRYYNELYRILGSKDLFKHQTESRLIWMYLQTKYDKELVKAYKKEFKKRFGYDPDPKWKSWYGR